MFGLVLLVCVVLDLFLLFGLFCCFVDDYVVGLLVCCGCVYFNWFGVLWGCLVCVCFGCVRLVCFLLFGLVCCLLVVWFG